VVRHIYMSLGFKRLITLEDHPLRNRHYETPKHTEAYYAKHFDVSRFFVRL